MTAPLATRRCWPWHGAVAIPAMFAEHAPSDDPRDLRCPACGETWRETDDQARGRAWASWCARLDRQDEAHVEKLRQRDAALRGER